MKFKSYFLYFTVLLSVLALLSLLIGIVYYIANKPIKAVIIDNPNFISSVDFSSDGLHIAVSSYDGTVKVIDSKTGSLIKLLPYRYDEFGEADLSIFSPDNSLIASTHRKNNIINIWDLKSNRLVMKLVGHNEEITAIAFSPEMDLLVTGSLDGMIKVWDLLKNKEKFALRDGRIKRVLFSKDGKIILSTSVSSTNITAWDATTGKKLTVLEGHSGYISTIDYNQSGTMIISGSVDSDIRFWTADFINTGLVLQPLHDIVRKVTLSDDEKLLACVYNDRNNLREDRIFIWHFKPGFFIQSLKKEIKIPKFQAIDFSPDCKFLVGATSNRVYIYQIVK